jgi:ubiquinone/menaquinone biosynthesis C-methylase UbiE
VSTSEQSRRFFEAIAGRYDRTYALEGAASRGRLAHVMKALPPHGRVLDLGVGTGRELSALLDAGHTPTGLDFASGMLAVSARRTRPVRLVSADFWAKLPFGDGEFDAAIALHGTLAHPPDETALDRLAAELCRVLTGTGVFVAEVPSPGWIAGLDPLPGGNARGNGDLRVHRTGPGRCLHEDLVADVSVEAAAFSPERWREIFSAWASVVVVPLESSELLITARR